MGAWQKWQWPNLQSQFLPLATNKDTTVSLAANCPWAAPQPYWCPPRIPQKKNCICFLISFPSFSVAQLARKSILCQPPVRNASSGGRQVLCHSLSPDVKKKKKRLISLFLNSIPCSLARIVARQGQGRSVNTSTPSPKWRKIPHALRQCCWPHVLAMSVQGTGKPLEREARPGRTH
ncbi:hypothetical protein LY78DRAFT_653454 [Colletotrichum sublineola]|nr:hypothetical protein LY78DRAFT_653454 [Colletotrichum sublineola]